MRRLTFAFATGALVFSVAAFLRVSAPPAKAAERDAWQSERRFPPLVFTSHAWLDCSISSTAAGRQTLTTTSGPGFTFTTAMQPIKDGRVRVTNPGMHYEFVSYPTAKIAARFSGLGEGTITEMKAEVEVDVARFLQPEGPGTTIHFTASDIRNDGAYVEFTGVFVRAKDQKRFPFRVTFGSVEDGRGEVTPGGRQNDVPLLSNAVVLGSAAKPVTVTTTMYEAEDDTPVLR